MQHHYSHTNENLNIKQEGKVYPLDFLQCKNEGRGLRTTFRDYFLSALVMGSLAFGGSSAYGQTGCSSITPVVKDDGPVLINYNAPYTITAASLLANDGTPGNLEIIGISKPANGTIDWVGGNLVYTPKAGFRGSDKFTYTVKRTDVPDVKYFNGRYYEFIYKRGGISWTDAKAAAEGKSLNGTNGYLVNITSAAENSFIQANLNQRLNDQQVTEKAATWMGANDAGTEGVWKWTGGPEADKTFYVKGATSQTDYSNWQPAKPGELYPEPNDAFGVEDYAYMLPDGYWNDYANDGRYTIDGNSVQLYPIHDYVVEYGTGFTEQCALTATATVNIVVASGTFATSAASNLQVDLLENNQTQLEQNYPNPFKGQTKVNFTVKETGNVSLKVYNIMGQEVKTLFEGQALKGKLYEASFAGENLARGVYFYTLLNGNDKITKRMLME